MNYEQITINSVDSFPLSVRIYRAQNPKAVIKFIHGMEEHQGRYENFATFLCKNGFTVVTSDMRGHGKTAKKLCHIADKNGEKLLLDDEKIIRDFIDKEFPKLPVYLFAHSMGTITARVLIQTDSNKYQKLALSGYPNYVSAAGIGEAIASTLSKLKGKDNHSKMLVNMSLGSYSKAIKDRKCDLDWLSYNEENVKNYIDDPLCGVDFTIASFKSLFHLLKELHHYKNCKNINKDLSILLLSGIDDPCVGKSKGREDSKNTLIKYGFNKIDMINFDNMRHEILQEKNCQNVYKVLLEFFNQK